MTTALFLLCVLIVGGSIALHLVARGAQSAAAALAAIATFALGFLLLTFNGANGGIRLSVESLQFSGAVREVSVGGDQTRDELYVRRVSTGVPHPVAAGLIRIDRDEHGAVAVRVRAGADAETPAVVQIDDNFVGAVPLANGASICWRRCDSDDAQWATVDPARNALAVGEVAGPELVRRPGRFGLPPIRDWGPASRIYPLRFFLPNAAEAGAETLKSFLFRNADGQMFAVLLDSNVRIREGGAQRRAAPDEEPVAVLCVNDEACSPSIKVRIFEVRYGDAPVSSASSAPSPRGYLSEMRSFTLEVGPDNLLRLKLDTPDAILLAQRDVEAEIDRLNRNESVPAVRLAAGPQRTESADAAFAVVNFQALGGVFQRVVDHRLIFDDGETRTAMIAHGSQSVAVPSGRTVQLGVDEAAMVRLEKLDGNWPVLDIARWVIVLGMVAGLIATWRARTTSATALTMFALLDLLLTLRVLIGVEAAYVDPGLEAREAPFHALATFLIAPLAVSLLCRATYETPLRLAAHAVFVALMLIWLDRTVAPLGLMAFVGGVVVAMALMFAAVSPLARAVKWPSALSAEAWSERISLRAWLVAVAGISLIRLLLVAAAGAQEALDLGGARLSISIFYVPVTILLFAQWFAMWRRRTDDRSAGAYVWSYLFAFIALCVVPLWAARDTGAIIYALAFALFGALAAFEQPEDGRANDLSAVLLLAVGSGVTIFGLVALATAAAPTADGFEGFIAWFVENPVASALVTVGGLCLLALIVFRARMALAIPAALVVGMIAYANIAPLLPAASTSRVEQALATPDWNDDIAILEDAGSYKAGSLRIISLVDRDALSDIGTGEAEGLSIALAHMADHSRLPWGPGFLQANAPAQAGLMRYHMNDNVTSVHVMGAFGRINAAAFVLTLFLALGVVAAARSQGSQGFDYFAGVLSVATLALVTGYMFLGNLEAAPFTGRNAYLLAVNSIGDVVEALGLFALALLFLGGKRA